MNRPLGKSGIGLDIGSAYEDKLLIDTGRPDYIYDDVDSFNKSCSEATINTASDVLYRHKSKKVLKTNGFMSFFLNVSSHIFF